MDKPRAFDAAKAVARAVVRETGLNEARELFGVTCRRAENYSRAISIAMSKDNPVITTVGDTVYPEFRWSGAEEFPWSGTEEIFSVIHRVGENGWLGKLMVTRGLAPVKEGHVIWGSKPAKTVELSIYDEGDDAELERLVESDPARRMALRWIAANYLQEGRAGEMPPPLQRLCAVAVAPRKWPKPERGQGKAISVIRDYRGTIVAEIVSALAELIPEISPTRNEATEPHYSICDAVHAALKEEGIHLEYATVAGYYKARNGPPKDPPAP